MSQHFLSLRNSGVIKTDLARLGQELATGKVTDIAAHLGGDTRQVSGIDHSLSVLSAFQTTANETGLLLENMQFALDNVSTQSSSTAEVLLKVSPQSSEHQISQAGTVARQAFTDIVQSFNGRFGGKSMFAGTAVHTKPLASAEEMLTNIRAELVGAATAQDVSSAVQQWFNDPAGGFATMGYQGGTGSGRVKQVGPNQNITISTRADDQLVKDLLASTAIAALAAEMGGNLTTSDQGDLQRASGAELLSGSAGLAEIMGVIGIQQGFLATQKAQFSAEQVSLEMAYNDLTLADPFETATRLQAVQAQLETHFAITARLSNLSLAEYI